MTTESSSLIQRVADAMLAELDREAKWIRRLKWASAVLIASGFIVALVFS
jgi:hypothetical protein